MGEGVMGEAVGRGVGTAAVPVVAANAVPVVAVAANAVPVVAVETGGANVVVVVPTQPIGADVMQTTSSSREATMSVMSKTRDPQ